MVIIKNISGSKKYFGFGFNHRGVTLEANATASIYPNKTERWEQVKQAIISFVESGDLEVVTDSNELTRVVTVTADYELSDSDNGRVIEVDASGGAVAISIPDGLLENFKCSVVNIDASNAVTIAKKAGGAVVVSSKGGTPTAPVLNTTAFKEARIYKVPGSSPEDYRVVGDVA